MSLFYCCVKVEVFLSRNLIDGVVLFLCGEDVVICEEMGGFINMWNWVFVLDNVCV